MTDGLGTQRTLNLCVNACVSVLGWGLDTAGFLLQLSFVARDVNWPFA